jgi:hypothetical protein
VPDHLLEGRLRGVELETIERRAFGLSSFPAELVANAVDERLPQISLKRTNAAGLEALDPLKRPDQGVLDKVVGIGRIARPPGQPSSGPALERVEVTGEQALQGLVVPCPRPADQMKGRLRIGAT